MSAVSAGPGALTIRAAVSNGYVRRAEITSTRPLAVSALFVGRPATEAPVLAASLFSLCGFSHRVAASLAIAGAMGKSPSPQARTAMARGLLAERAVEYLRSLVLDGTSGATVSPNALDALRAAMAAARDLSTLPPTPQASHQAVARLITAARAVLSDRSHQAAMAETLERAAGEQAFLARAPDGLGPDDDETVAALLALRGTDFSQSPALPGRVVETGAFARTFDGAWSLTSAIAARLSARLKDLEATLAALTDDDSTGLWTFGGTGGYGFGAVESPRGRLYHGTRLDDAGRAAQYGIVAPTEWNFHPQGPFIALVLGAKTGDGPRAERLITWLAAMFDPCVAFRVTLEDGDHA